MFFGLLLAVSTTYAQEGSSLSVMMQSKQDSLKILEERMAERRNGRKPKSALSDSIPKDSVIEKPGILVDKIRYKAKAYAKMSTSSHAIYLYDEAELYYQDTELTSGKIDMDYLKNEVYAGRLKDKEGKDRFLNIFPDMRKNIISNYIVSRPFSPEEYEKVKTIFMKQYRNIIKSLNHE